MVIIVSFIAYSACIFRFSGEAFKDYLIVFLWEKIYKMAHFLPKSKILLKFSTSTMSSGQGLEILQSTNC